MSSASSSSGPGPGGAGPFPAAFVLRDNRSGVPSGRGPPDAPAPPRPAGAASSRPRGARPPVPAPLSGPPKGLRARAEVGAIRARGSLPGPQSQPPTELGRTDARAEVRTRGWSARSAVPVPRPRRASPGAAPGLRGARCCSRPAEAPSAPRSRRGASGPALLLCQPRLFLASSRERARGAGVGLAPSGAEQRGRRVCGRALRVRAAGVPPASPPAAPRRRSWDARWQLRGRGVLRDSVAGRGPPGVLVPARPVPGLRGAGAGVGSWPTAGRTRAPRASEGPRPRPPSPPVTQVARVLLLSARSQHPRYPGLPCTANQRSPV